MVSIIKEIRPRAYTVQGCTRLRALWVMGAAIREIVKATTQQRARGCNSIDGELLHLYLHLGFLDLLREIVKAATRALLDQGYTRPLPFCLKVVLNCALFRTMRPDWASDFHGQGCNCAHFSLQITNERLSIFESIDRLIRPATCSSLIELSNKRSSLWRCTVDRILRARYSLTCWILNDRQ